jgi:hypothetical protein
MHFKGVVVGLLSVSVIGVMGRGLGDEYYIKHMAEVIESQRPAQEDAMLAIQISLVETVERKASDWWEKEAPKPNVIERIEEVLSQLRGSRQKLQKKNIKTSIEYLSVVTAQPVLANGSEAATEMSTLYKLSRSNILSKDYLEWFRSDKEFADFEPADATLAYSRRYILLPIKEKVRQEKSLEEEAAEFVRAHPATIRVLRVWRVSDSGSGSTNSLESTLDSFVIKDGRWQINVEPR